MTLEALKTYTTRYTGEDGRERAVLLMENYDWLISKVESRPAKSESPVTDNPQEDAFYDRYDPIDNRTERT